MTRRIAAFHLLACVLALASAGSASAQQPVQKWGSLEGTFRIVGPVAAPAPIAGIPPAACAAAVVVDESLLVGDKNGIENVVIYLQSGGVNVPVHPARAAALVNPVQISAAGCRLDPHVAVMTAGQRLELVNRDATTHNVKVDLIANASLNALLKPGGLQGFDVPAPEIVPGAVGNSIYPWMQGQLLVAETPYATTTDAKGRFHIDDLPVGVWTFRVWHERAGYIDQVTIGGQAVRWNRGRVTVNVKEGANSLGVVEVSSAEF